METTEYLEALRRDGAAFGEACEAAGLDASVAACPGWTVADLLWHLGEVHDFWRTVVERRLGNWNEYTRPERPRDADLLAFYRDGLGATCSVLAATDPSTEVWTWSSDKTGGFVIRRMAHETAVHRCDAEHAAGRDHTIEPLLASDGIDEFLAHFLGDATEGAAPVGGSVHLHCSDVPGEWTLRSHGAGFEVTREHAKGDCAIRGTANEILLGLWRRIPSSRLDIVGDAAVGQRFLAHASLE
jgi:uncharacterized protein (TIGR03083 family)